MLKVGKEGWEPSWRQRLGWWWWVWEWQSLKRLPEGVWERLKDLSDRARGIEMFQNRVKEFADGPGEYSRQLHRVFAQKGWFGWEDTGIITKWEAQTRDDEGVMTHLFDGVEYAEFSEAVEAWRRKA